MTNPQHGPKPKIAMLSVAPQRLTFGSVPVGTGVTIYLNVHNHGTVEITGTASIQEAT